MLGLKFYKSLSEEDRQQYTEGADYCSFASNVITTGFRHSQAKADGSDWITIGYKV